jgi:hypothetical protein
MKNKTKKVDMLYLHLYLIIERNPMKTNKTIINKNTFNQIKSIWIKDKN